MSKKIEKKHKLTEPKILNLFISSLKELYRQQEIKKKNYKKLINSFSVRTQNFEDNHNNNQQQLDYKLTKNDFIILSAHYRKKKSNECLSHNSDSSIYNSNNNNEKVEAKRINHVSLNKTLQNERMKFLKHKFFNEQKKSKKFLLESEGFHEVEKKINIPQKEMIFFDEGESMLENDNRDDTEESLEKNNIEILKGKRKNKKYNFSSKSES